MNPRRLLLLTAVVAVVLVVAAGASRATYVVGGVEQACPERVWSSALNGLTTGRGEPIDPCAVASRGRLFTVAASLMGLVLISGLLHRGRT